VLVRDDRVLSTGYNGAPEGWGNCGDPDVCFRCENRDEIGPGNAYDKCVCVHAEMNAIVTAARFGASINGATIYVTHQPCITCAKELVQAHVARTHYIKALTVEYRGDDELDRKLKEMHRRLMGQIEAVQVTGCDVEHALQRGLELLRA
jgi:dCMP deaminase